MMESMESSVNYITFFEQGCYSSIDGLKRNYPNLVESIAKGVSVLKTTHKSLLNIAIVNLLELAKNDSYLYERIRQVCLQNNLLTDRPKLSDYQTRNLIPVKSEPGRYGGLLITVKVNPDFTIDQADERAARCFRQEAAYQLALSKATKPIPEPDIPGLDYFKLFKKFPTYSSNPASTHDPQGDIGWMLLLPTEVQQFFGFSNAGDHFTFPDVAEANGAIETLNQRASDKQLGEPFLPYRLRVVKGLETENYLFLRSHGLLPIASPQKGKSWFYHDFNYHFIGMLLTPVKSLRIATRFINETYPVIRDDENAKENLIQHLDHSTTWSLRISAILYANTHPQRHFYCFDHSIVPKPTESFQELIIHFAYFQFFQTQHGIYKSASTSDYAQAMKAGDYFSMAYQTHVKTLLKSHPSVYGQLVSAVAEHHRMIASVCIERKSVE